MKYNLYNNREGIIELSGNLSQNTNLLELMKFDIEESSVGLQARYIE